jgi:hypothetical protein
MKINELLLTEWKAVVKNKDGKEKRFSSHDSPDAIAWKNSSSPVKAKKPGKYSEEWWDQQDVDTLPWDKITDLDGIEPILKDHFGSIQTDPEMLGSYSKTVDGVPVAGRKVRVMFRVTPEDDMGVDEPVEDSQMIKVVRDVKNPTKLVFDGY